MKEVKEKLIELISYFHMYDLILFSALLLLAMCFIFLSFIIFRKKFISIFCFLLGFCIILAIPFVLRYILQERFYKIDIETTYDSTYNYSDVYQYIGTITNTGKHDIAGCIFSHQILYDVSEETGLTKYKHMLLNYVKPKKIYNKDIPMDLKVGQSITISEVMENYPHKGEKHSTKLECYGKKKNTQSDRILQGHYKQKPAENGTQNTLNVQTQNYDFNTLEKELDAMVFDQSEILHETQELLNTQNINTHMYATQNNTPLDSKQQGSKDKKENANDDKIKREMVLPEEIPQAPAQAHQTPEVDTQLEDKAKWRELRDNFSVPLLKESPR